MHLTTLLAERAASEWNLNDPEPSALAAFISEFCNVSPDKADALVWGEDVELATNELDLLAKIFCLHRDLLACYMQPTTDEMVRHVLSQIAALSLNVDACMVCNHLYAEIEDADRKDGPELQDLCFTALYHLTVNDADFDNDEIPGYYPGESLHEDFDRVLSRLPQDAQKRVLAYAYQELAGTVDTRSFSTFSAYSQLRESYLQPLARKVFDLLAASEDGSLPSREVMHTLGLGDGRALGQLARSVHSSLQTLGEHGITIDHEPLVVDRRAKRLRLSPEALRAWRALMHTDRAPSPLQEA